MKSAPEREAGAVLGQQAALMLLAVRSADRLFRVEAPARDAAAGAFAMPGDAKMPRSIAITGLAPFGVRSVQAFDPGPPPALASDAQGRARAEEDRAARGRAHARARRDDLGRRQHRQHLAQGAVRHWRPESAITGPFAAPADRDPAWQSLVRVPNSPQYPSGGGNFAGTAEVEMPRLFAIAGPIEWRNGQTGQSRRWPDAASMADEIASSRVWAGVHFRSAVDAGRRVGRQVASEIPDRQLLPR